MADDILAFNYDQETNEGILPKSSASVSSGAYSIPGVKPVMALISRQNRSIPKYVVSDKKKTNI